MGRYVSKEGVFISGKGTCVNGYLDGIFLTNIFFMKGKIREKLCFRETDSLNLNHARRRFFCLYDK